MSETREPRPLALVPFRLLLRTLPRDFRVESGRDMQELVLDMFEACRRKRGRLAAWLLAARACFELVGLAVTTRFEPTVTALPVRRNGMNPPWDGVWSNLRTSARVFRREPTYAVAFVLTLCLGIGVNAAVFSLVNGVLLEPLPYPDAERLVLLSQPARAQDNRDLLFSLQEVGDLRRRSRTLEQVVEYGDIGYIVQGGDGPHRARGGLVTPNFFAVLGMRPQLGRTLHADDFGEGATPVAVLSHAYWSRVYGGRRDVVGEVLDLTDERAEIVGVLEPAAHYGTSVGPLDFYLNYAADEHYRSAGMQDVRAHRMTTVFAKLAPGIDAQNASAELGQIAAAFGEEYPEAYPAAMDITMRATPWKESITDNARPTLLLLFATASFVLLAACTNVANLTLMRQQLRAPELSLRAALGAGRWRLRRLLLLETSMLTLAGATLGLLVASVGMRLLIPYVERYTTRTHEIGIDLGVLGFTAAVSMAAAVAIAFVPRLDGVAGAGAAGAVRPTTAGSTTRLLQRGLVVAQFAISLIILVGAGLTTRTLVNLYAEDPGFDLHNVLRVDATKFAFRSNRAEGAEERRIFTDSLIAELEEHPSIESVAVSAAPPLLGGGARPLAFQVDGEGDPDAGMATAMPMVSGGYFATMGIELLRGRTFDPATDTPDVPPVAVIDEAMAEHYFGPEDPLGHRLGAPGADPSTWYTVVGVVADSRFDTLEDRGVHTLYRAESQNRSPFTVLVRTRGEPGPVIPHVLGTIRRLDPERAIENVETLAARRAEAMAPQRLNATLFALLAGLALAIAAVGIAGTIAFAVSQRRREIGIRLALGAAPDNVTRLMVREGGLLAVIGIACGLLGAVALSGTMSSLLFDIDPIDPVSFIGAAVFLFFIGAVTS